MLIHCKALSLCAAVAMTASGLVAATPAHAQSDRFTITGQRADVPVRRVGYDDLNLAFAPDRITLVSRVGYAVKEVCRERLQNAEKTLASFTRYGACRDFAWSGARPQLAAAINRSRAMALKGNGAVAVGSLAITISAPAGF